MFWLLGTSHWMATIISPRPRLIPSFCLPPPSLALMPKPGLPLLAAMHGHLTTSPVSESLQSGITHQEMPLSVTRLSSRKIVLFLLCGPLHWSPCRQGWSGPSRDSEDQNGTSYKWPVHKKSFGCCLLRTELSSLSIVSPLVIHFLYHLVSSFV